MSGMNAMTIVGNLGHEPELEQGRNGTPWLRMNVATQRRTKGGEVTDWHDVRVFGDQAVTCATMLRKGSQVCVEGQLIYDKWVDEDEQTQRRARVLARRVHFLNRYGNQGLAPTPDGGSTAAHARSAYA